MEKVIARLPVKCKHGCPANEMSLAEMTEHEKQCSYRLVKCVNHGCDEKIRLTDLIDHFRSKHTNVDDVKSKIFDSDQVITSISFSGQGHGFSNPVRYFLKFMKCQDQDFATIIKMDLKNFGYVYNFIVGSEEDADGYKCRVEVSNPDTGYKVANEGYINGIDDAKYFKFDNDDKFDNKSRYIFCNDNSEVADAWNEPVPSMTLHPQQVKKLLDGDKSFDITLKASAPAAEENTCGEWSLEDYCASR